MKTRLHKTLSALLALCMLLSMLPVSVLAAETEPGPDEQLALYMADIGLVDETGTLIPDNTFTVEDGTKLESLDALLDYLGECEEADMDTLITVDATGKSATADWLLRAISVESQVGLLSGMLNTLAGGALTQNAAATVSPHDLHLVQTITNDSDNKDILIIRVGVSGTANGEFIAAPNDIQIQSGLFANHLRNVTSGPVPGISVNAYTAATLAKGDTCIEYTLDLAVIRENYNGRDLTYNPWGGSDHTNGENGHWGGFEIALLQSRVISGAPEQSVQSYFYFAPFEDPSPLYKSATGLLYRVGNSGSASKPVVFTFPTSATDIENSVINASDGSYFTFTPQAANLVKDTEGGGFSLTSVFRDAWELGVGDADKSIIIEDAYALLKVDNTASNSTYAYGIAYSINPGEVNIDPFDFDLYRYDNSTLTWLADGTPLYLYTGGKDGKATEIANTVSGSWPNNYIGIYTDEKTVYNQLMAEANVDNCLENTTSLNDRRIGLYFSNLKLSSSDYSDDGVEIKLPTLAFRTNNLKTPLTFATGGKVKLADTTKPTVKDVYVQAYEDTFRPGDVIPIVVEFSEPVYGEYNLEYEYNNETKTLSSGTTTSLNCYGTVQTANGMLSGRTSSNDMLLSNRRVFYYTVQPGDTGIKVTGVSEIPKVDTYLDYYSKDIFGNTFENVKFATAYTLSGHIRSASVKDTISSVSATVDAFDPTEMTVTLNLKDNTLTEQLWGNWNTAAADAKPFTVSVILNGEKQDTEAVLQQDGKSVAYTITLEPLETGTRDFTIELYIDEGDFSGKYYGAYTICTQKAIVKANTNAFTISADSWHSGTDNLVYVQDQTIPVFSAAAGTQTDYTFKGTDQFYWVSSDESVFTVNLNSGTENTLQSSPTVSITPLKEGTATLALWSRNGGIANTAASNSITITVKDDDRPTLLLADNANTFFARQETDLTFSFTSNLGTKYSEGDDSPITVTLYENGGATPLWTDTLARDKTEVTIPGSYLTTISKDNTPSYHVTLTSSATYYGASKDLSTDAYIVVRSQPARVTLPWTTAPLLTSDETLTIQWSTENWDATNLDSCAFDFRVEKNGVIYGDSHITDVGQAASGSYLLVPDTPSGLKDEYVILIKAKNASDPTWSSASAIITVYRADALDLVVGGKKVDEITLKNDVTQTATTTAPTIQNYEGTTFDGLTTAQAIAGLRSQLSLMESISINYADYDWNYVNDMFRWSTTESEQNAGITDAAKKLQEIVSINYRQGGYYEPLENFSYLYYIPKALMMLSGLSEGSTTVTAQHSAVESMESSVTVNVELLKNKLYLFQFSPAATITVTYEDSKGVTHTVNSNPDGSLALFEPDGIASALRCISTDAEDQIYRGTVGMLGDTYNVSLKSGEGNGIYDELYPLNAVELRPAASVSLTLLKPDGSPLSNANVTLRGGVYRNPNDSNISAQRDAAYCPEAKFSKTKNGDANLDGKTDQTFKTNDNGVLNIYMDTTQFISQNDPDAALGLNDTFRYIFELRFQNDEYEPEILIADTEMTQRDIIRSGGNLLTLTKASGKKPVVSTQTVDYFTGREISVRRHTGVVGPSADYPTVRLSTRLLLWGMEEVGLDDTRLSFDVRTQETAVNLSGQSRTNIRDASYPFSSLPILENVTNISTDSFEGLKATKRIPMELAIHNGDGTLNRTVTLPFGLIDMTAVEKVSQSESVIGLMTRLTAEGSNVLPDLNENKVMKVADDLLDVIGLLEGVGAKLGFIRTVLMPTEDPTIYSAYVWMGYDTTTMADLRYDDNGIYVEPAHLVQDLEQVSFAGFTIGDYKAMSDGTYFERLQKDNSALATRIFGAGNVMQGWMSAEICYNFNEGRWEVITTGGAMTFGKQFEKPIQKQRFKPILYNYGVVLRGGLVVTLETAIRYAEQLGSGQGTPEMVQAINDYLTSIRVNAFIELYGGIGIDKYGVAFTIGAYGDVELNTETRILKRGDESGKDYGDFIQLDGKIGLREKVGIGSLVLQFDLVSISVGDQWKVRDWEEVTTSWANNQSGYKTGWIDGKNTQTSGKSSYSTQSAGREVIVATSGGEVRVQSREYLQEGQRAWLGGGGIATLDLQTGSANRLGTIETNSYPFSAPMISDDGGLLVYLSDADSTDVEDVEVRFAKMSGETFANGSPISAPIGFDGYGDSDLDFDGSYEKGAAAIWLRQSAHMDLHPGADVTLEQQLVLTNGLEVVASIWDGTNQSWSSTRLTENATQELSPIIAINADGSKAVAAWRSVQRGDGLLNFTENRVLFKLYDSTKGWSDETYTLYNGSSGSVTSMSIEMIGDTALIAYTVDPDDAEGSSKDSEIYYALVDTTAAAVEDAVKTVRVTTNEYLDADPKLTTAGNLFVLGWYREQDDASDIGLLTIDQNGAPRSDLPASLSDVVSTASFNGKFTFVKGADSLDELSLLWDDSKSGDEDNDVIRAIKFSNFGTADAPSYGASAAVEVAALPANTQLDSMDAYTYYGTDVQAVLQTTTYSVVNDKDANTYNEINFTYYTDSGEEQTIKAKVPKETVTLYSAMETYTDAVEVTGTSVDFSTLAVNSYVPVTFTLRNQGIHAIQSVDVTLDGTTQTFGSLNLLPGQSKTLSVVVQTGTTIKDLDYTATATFSDNSKHSATGTVYLDYPDVGISTLTVTGEENGKRSFLATLYNQSAASLNKGDRRVVLGVYTDPSCSSRINGKYFEGGTTDQGYELILDASDALSQIDSASFAQPLTFDIASYMKDAGQSEIPDAGVTLFVKARVEKKVNGEWVELPEADTQNNQKSITFHSLLERSSDGPVTLSVEMNNSGSASSASVQLRNHSLQSRSGGRLVAALLDANGNLLETKPVGNVSLTSEQLKTETVAFSKTGARVVLRYAEPEGGDSNAAVKSLTINGLPITLDSFDQNGKAELFDVARGSYLLSVVPESADAVVTVNGKTAENGMAEITAGDVYTIVVTSKDATASTTYVVTLYAAAGRSKVTLSFETNGGSALEQVRKSYGTTVDLSAYQPTKSGFTFAGWYADAALTEKVTQVKLTRNTTVYAAWAEGESPFTDVTSKDWFYESVLYAYENGLMKGTGDSRFSPAALTTRDMIVTILYRLAGSPEVTGTCGFADVKSGSWYERAVIWASQNGIVTGYGTGDFGPGDDITREQLATILYRYAKYSGLDVSVGEDTNILSYDDALAISDYAFPAMQWACGAGLIQGTSQTTLSPSGLATRAEAAAILHRFCTKTAQ